MRTEDILNIINENSDSISLIMLGGVNYYTGQVFDMQKITVCAHKYNIMVGFDLAHAAGNIDLSLNDWELTLLFGVHINI